MLKEGYVVDPFDLETVTMLERVLNYAHTGSARVLTRALMDRAWLSLSVVNDGLPCISPSFIQPGALTSGLIHVRRDKWPVHPVTLIPLTASQRSQELTYGKPHYSVSLPYPPTPWRLHWAIVHWHTVLLAGHIPHFRTPLKCGIAMVAHEYAASLHFEDP